MIYILADASAKGASYVKDRRMSTDTISITKNEAALPNHPAK